jgi:hypothetical protein
VAARLEGLSASEATRKALAESRDQLALPFLLVVVGPYAAFVHREKERLDETQAALAGVGGELDALSARVDVLPA